VCLLEPPRLNVKIKLKSPMSNLLVLLESIHGKSDEPNVGGRRPRQLRRSLMKLAKWDSFHEVD
jgi:hypothetical protein